MDPHDDEITLRELVAILSKRKRAISAITLGFLALAGVYAFLLAKPTYESTAILSVSPLKVKAQLEEKIQLQQRGLLTYEGLKALALSQGNLVRTMEQLKASGSLPEDWRSLSPDELLVRLQKNLNLVSKTAGKAVIPGEPPTLIVSLSAKAKDPNLAARIANAWSQSTAKIVNELPAKQIEANLRALNEQLAPAEAAYRRAQEAWEAFAKKDLRQLWKKQLAEISNKLAKNTRSFHALLTEIKTLEAKYRSIMELLGKTPETLEVSDTITKNPTLGQIALSKDIASLQGLKLKRQVVNPVYISLMEKAHATSSELARLREEKVALEQEIAREEKLVRELTAKVAAAELEADRLQETLRLAKETYLALKQKQTDLKIELASIQNSLAQILAPAYPVPEPVAPRRGLILALAGFLGLMVGILWAFIAAALEEPEAGPQEARAGHP